MKKWFYVLICSLSFLILATSFSFAESDYVLPYPSSMPGSKFYQIRLFWDELKKYWSFGNFGRFKYNLNQSGKYLVEAKTLFEYKQYLLGYKALKESSLYFNQTFQYLIKAQSENKDISKNLLLLKEAALKHIEVLKKVESQTPETFIWQPEKSLPTTLNIKKQIEESIAIREKYL